MITPFKPFKWKYGRESTETPMNPPDLNRAESLIAEWVQTNFAPINSPAFSGEPSSAQPKLSEESSTLATTQFVKRLVRGINPVTFEGFDPMGLQDSTVALEEALKASHESGLPLVFPDESIVKTKSFSKSWSPKIIGNNSIIELQTAGGLVFQGKLSGLKVNINATAEAGSNKISILTAEKPVWLKAGIQILLGTKKQINGDSNNRYRGQQLQVLEVKEEGANTIVTTREMLVRTFTTAEENWNPEGGKVKEGKVEGTLSAYIELVEPIVKPEIGGLTITNPLELNTRLLVVKFGTNINIDVETNGALQPALEIRSCYGGFAQGRGINHKWNNSNQFGYNVAATGSTANVDFYAEAINSNYAFNTTAVDGESGDTTFLRVRGRCVNSNTSSWGTHPAGYYTTFYDVESLNSAEAGIGWSSAYVRYFNPTVIGTGIGKNFEGQSETNGHGCWGTMNGSESLSGSTLTPGSSVGKGFEIKGGTFRRINGDGVRIESTTGIVTDLLLTNGFFVEVKKIGGIHSSCQIENLKQIGNFYEKYGLSGVSGSNYPWRFEKAVTGYIRNETINAEGASPQINHIDEASPGLSISGIKANNVSENGINWRNDKGGISYDGTSWINGLEISPIYEPKTTAGKTLIDPSKGKLQKVVLAENSTAELANGIAGAELVVDVLLEGHTWAWSSNVEFPGGVTPGPWNEGNRHNKYRLIWDEVNKKWEANIEGVGKEQLKQQNVKPETALPNIPSEGLENLAEIGIRRGRTMAVKGTGAKPGFKLVHKLATENPIVQVYVGEESGGKIVIKESSPATYKIKPEGSEKFEILFTSSPGAGEILVIEAIGA